MGQRISLDGLRYAATVAQMGSFSEAARAHQLSQPALSTAVARLEHALGAHLFDRSPTGVSLTAIGAQLMPLARKVVMSVDTLTSEAKRLQEPTTETIRMGISPLISPTLVAAAFAAARSLSASVQRSVILREANMDELIAALKGGDLDVILVPSVGPIPLFEHRVVDEEPVVVLDSSSVSTDPVELGDVMDNCFILVPDACGLTRFTHQLFASRNRAATTYPGEAASYRVLEEWAHLGLGTALIPQSRLTSPQTACRPLVDDGDVVTIYYEAAWDPRSSLAADLEELAAIITTQR